MSFENPSFGQKSEKSLVEQLQEQMRNITKEMAEKSQYRRERLSDLKEQIVSPEGENFLIEHVKDAESPDVKKIFKFMEKFNPEECDTIEIIQDAIENPTDAYAYHIIKDEKGKVIAHSESSYLEIPPENQGDKPKEAVLFIGCNIVDDKHQRKGLGTEICQTFFETGAKKAKNHEQSLKGIIGEAVETSEKFWNQVGMKRMYFEDGEGNIQEVPYICPPIQWDEKTGLPLDPETEEIGDKDIKEYSAPEHLMVRMIDGRQEINASELLAMIGPVYTDNYTLYRNEGEEYPTDEAIGYSRKAVRGFRDELEAVLRKAKDGKIILLDAKEREEKIKELQASGKNFNELVIEEKDGE